MLANYLAAALRNLARNGLYAGVTIAGLAIAFTAAILIFLFVRDEYSYDRFIPGFERTYRVEQVVRFGSDPELKTASSQPMLAARLKAAFPEFETIARITSAPLSAVRHGQIGGREEFLMSADPDFFKVMPMPAIAGDPARALETPDGVIITRAKARQYFGQDRPLGQILEIEKHPWRVTAVLEDYPSQTHMQAEIFTSALASYSPMRRWDEQMGAFGYAVVTYVRLKPGASIESVRARLPAFAQRELVAQAPPQIGKISMDMYLTPLADIHLHTKGEGAGKTSGDPRIIAAIAAVGVLIVIVAAINFITLMTARAARRAVEVGVRKASGASRRDLVVQFMGEAFLYVLFSVVLAMALAEVLLPTLNAFLQRRIELNYLRDAQIMAGLAVLTVTTALTAGAYPALVLSGFNPAAVLKGQGLGGGHRGRGSRQGLVIFQFTVLIALILTALTIFRQTSYALGEGMRVNADQTLQVFVSPCTMKLRERVQAVPGVQGAACSSPMAVNYNNWRDSVVVGGRSANLSFAAMDFGFFDVYGVKPSAGRIFDPKRPADARRLKGPPPPVVLNESAVRKVGFASPVNAVGQSLTWHYGRGEAGRSEIIGVVPDFTFGSLRQMIEPTFYFVVAEDFIANDTQGISTILNVKLDGARIPEALKGLDQAVSRYGDGRPVSRRFTDQLLQRLYQDTITQGVAIGVCAGIALSIACLGLFALSAYTTERRTKEIGVRKAMGAATGDVLKLLIWQFTLPVLIANLIAWPIAFLLMRRWLDGFAYRVDLAPWTFVAAGAAALLIAWATVFVHALKVARAKPVGALRYE